MLGNERLNGELVFVKPNDHEDFHMALVRAKIIASLPVRDCQQDPPRLVENHNHVSSNGQPKLLSGHACEEPIMSANRIP